MADPPASVPVNDDAVQKSRRNVSNIPEEYGDTTYQKNPADHWQTVPYQPHVAPTGGAKRKMVRSANDDGDLPDASLASPDHKKHRVGSPDAPKSKPTSRVLWKEHERRCCNCTKISTCQTTRCQCYAHGTECVNCESNEKCCNKGPERKIITPKSKASETDASRASNADLVICTVISTPQPGAGPTEDDGATPGVRPSSDAQATPQTHTDDEIGDLPDYIMSEADKMMDGAYGDHVHQNPGKHLNGGIADDPVWQDYWRRLVVFRSTNYDVPKGKVGKRFLTLLTGELNGIRKRQWNAERFLIFQNVILQRERTVKRSRDIRQRLSRRMDAWELGKFQMLVEDTIRTKEASLSFKQGFSTPEQRAKIYNSKMLRGDIRGAVRYLTERDQGGILFPDNTDEKSGDTVLETLQSKHPDATIPEASSLQTYPSLPDFNDIDVTEDVVESVARRLRGCAGPSGTDSLSLQQWLLRFGETSRQLRIAVADFVDWLANEFPPWAAYRATMACLLFGLDKDPGVRPVGAGETWRRLFAKVVLRIAGGEAKEACGIDQLCAGLEAGIEGGIHAINQLWREFAGHEDWGFLLVDAKNAFNELNRIVMLWTIWHEWPSCAKFAFNCYRHFVVLVIRSQDGKSTAFIFSKEGVTQGDALAMAAYGVGLLPLIRRLKKEFPNVKQPWYADDAGAGGSFQDLRLFFRRLQEIGPAYGYHPEPTKSILIVQSHNVESARLEFEALHFKVTSGCRYLGGFVGDSTLRDEWLEEKTSFWTAAIGELAATARLYPQSAYTGLQRSLQQEWQYVQRVVGNISESFSAVEKAIRDDFIPALFGEEQATPDNFRKLLALPVKHAGIALPNPTVSGPANHKASILVCSHLLAAFRGTTEFCTVDHLSVRREVFQELQKRKNVECSESLASSLLLMPVETRRTIRRGKETGMWLTLAPSTVNGTELSSQEFRDHLFLRYDREPPDLPSHCDGCLAKFDICHALQCKKGGLVIMRHNEIKDELCDLLTKALVPSAVRDEPRIYPCRPAVPPPQKEPDPVRRINSLVDDDRGDILVRGFWARGTDCIIDVRVTNTDAKSQRHKDPDKILAQHEREKKRKYLEPCLKQRRHFTPFVVSTDGLLGREATLFLKRLASVLSDKWHQPYSVVCGFVRSRMSIAIARATHMCLRGSRVPTSQMCNRRPQWEDRAGLGLHR
jgi:hypothetical protein